MTPKQERREERTIFNALSHDRESTPEQRYSDVSKQQSATDITEIDKRPLTLPGSFRNLKQDLIQPESVYFEGNFDLYSEEQKVDDLF